MINLRCRGIPASIDQKEGNTPELLRQLNMVGRDLFFADPSAFGDENS